MAWDVLMVDEAHRIPFSGEGKYRTFITESQKFNPNLRVIGWTATPFRMAGGQICHKDHILNEVCYEARVTDLIRDGYLCNLRSKVGETQPELKDVKRNSGGDYILKSLAEATNRDKLVFRAVAEAVRIINAENRRAVVFFCVDIEHCKRVSYELRKYGIFAPFVTGRTKSNERDHIAAAFRAGRLRAVCNVNVYTEGFNARHIDCIVLLRPTLSPGLFSQMVGRGLRTHKGKLDCLILDFAGCIDEHGPVDLLRGGSVVNATCKQCQESFSRATRKCPACGWEIPKQEIERLDEVERQRRLHGDKASKKSILSSQPETYKVDSVIVERHRKEGSPDSLRVKYVCGLSMFREWVCLDHDGFAGRKAREWWVKRFNGMSTVDEALENMFVTQRLLEWTKAITVRRKGKYFEIVDYNRPVVEEAA
jgi:DNA repair protein RadD